MSEELNKEEVTEETKEEIKEEITETQETSEDTSKNESSEDSQESLETKETIDTVSKERFDGLMSARQRVETENEKLRGELETAKATSSQDEDDKLTDYLYKKFEDKRRATETAKQEAIEREMVNVRDIYPQFTKDELFKTALKYAHNGTPIPLVSAAKILQEAKSNATIQAKTAGIENDRKQATGGISGRSGVSEESGIQAYNSKKDKDKSIAELISDGRRELAGK